ncbi:MAG: FAD:protein FMN transferase [Oscillospiraceae bacterium]|nr:FAD:protein FMN transferase [Oscillospiraceae bacterium]
MKKTAALLTIAILAGVILFVAGANKRKATPFVSADFAMGSVLSASIYGKNDIAPLIFEGIKKAEAENLSEKLSSSDIYKINHSENFSAEVSPYTSGMIKKCVEISSRCGGYFDITVGGLVNLWGFGGTPSVPSQEDIDDALLAIGYDKIFIENNYISKSPGQLLDMGAVGKGAACDIAYDIIKNDASVRGAAVSVGGSVLVCGRGGKSGWTVGVRDPDKTQNDYMGILTLEEGFISTSGNYEKVFEEGGIKHHHILNPFTGYPSESGLKSVTVIAPTGFLSDALSTACFIIGYEKSVGLLEIYGADGIFITEGNEVLLTENVDKSFKITDGNYMYG